MGWNIWDYCGLGEMYRMGRNVWGMDEMYRIGLDEMYRIGLEEILQDGMKNMYEIFGE